MTLKDLQTLHTNLSDRTSRLARILSALDDERNDDDDRRVRIDGYSSVWMPLEKIEPLLRAELDADRAELERVNHALATATDVANGLMNKPA